MPASHISDPEHWRARARQARAQAEQMADAQAKEAMLRVAKDYEKLAQRAAARSREPKPE
jgi:hypothetical protein